MPSDDKTQLPEDPLALHAPRLFWAFGWYLRWFFWRNFHAVRIARCDIPDVPADRPLIIYARAKGTWRFLRRDTGWHKFERNARAATAQA